MPQERLSKSDMRALASSREYKHLFAEPPMRDVKSRRLSSSSAIQGCVGRSMTEVLVQIAKIVIAFFGEVLLWIFNAFLWLAATAESTDNLVTALVLLAVVVFAPGLWLAKHLREKE
jgi:hypothetical protein